MGRAVCHWSSGLLLALSLDCAMAAPPATRPSREYEMKAAYLYTFAQFVTWPAEAFAGSSAPVVIGILGDDPFRETLDRTIRNQTVRGRPIHIRRTARIEDLRSCHILFLSSTERRRLPQVLAGLRGASVLTVSEMEHFGSQGGMVTLYSESDKVRFAINVAAAERAGLKVSSKLLKLARPMPEVE